MTEGERIKKIRKENKMTLEQFGNKLGVGKTTISRIENGINNITEQMRKSICREFRVNPIWLSTGKGNMFIEQPNNIKQRLENILSRNNRLTELLLEILEQYTSDDWSALEHIVTKSAKYIKQLDTKETSVDLTIKEQIFELILIESYDILNIKAISIDG